MAPVAMQGKNFAQHREGRGGVNYKTVTRALIVNFPIAAVQYRARDGTVRVVRGGGAGESLPPLTPPPCGACGRLNVGCCMHL
jgi:hypothetical protein